MSTWRWPAPVDDGAAAHLIRGLKIPALALPSTGGRSVSLVDLSRRTALFVYPWTGRPGGENPPDWDHIAGAHGSTPELVAIANLFSGFEGLGVAALAISGQDTAWQSEFAARHGLPFEVLSDHDGRLRDALRLPTFETGGVRYLKRLTLVVSAGQVERCFYPVHPPDIHPREVLAWMSATATYAAEARLKPTT